MRFTLVRKLLLKDTGCKPAHVEKQMARHSISAELTERLKEHSV